VTARARLAIGLGTGRSGTNSLAHLIAMQPGAVGTHERLGPGVAWVGGEAAVDQVLNAMLAELAAGKELALEVGFYYLPYVARIRARVPDARFVVLKRDRNATIESFMAKTRDKAHHWVPETLTTRRKRWNQCFPKYEPGTPKRVAVGRYYDEYYAVTDALERAEPGVFFTLRTEELGVVATQRRLLDFLGVPRDEQRTEAGLQTNRGEDVGVSALRPLRQWIEGIFRRRDED
jgi:hypothetical protein